MAGMTKEQRLEKEKEKEQELRAKIEKELEEKYKLEQNNDVTTVSSVKPIKELKKTNKKNIPLDLEVPVTSNYTGNLIFLSKKSNGYSVEWDEYGMTEFIEIGELLSMRNTDRRFFEDNWIIIGDTDDYTAEEIYSFLKVDKYYKNVYSPEDIDSFFNLSPNDMIKKISTLSKGMKDCIAVKAQEMINQGELDSNKKIETLAEALKVEFTKNTN